MKTNNENALTIRLKPAQLRWLEESSKMRGVCRQELIRALISEQILKEKMYVATNKRQ